MRKLFFVVSIFFLLISCDNDSVEKQTKTVPNPYPDGVYPFEVSRVGHTYKDYGLFSVTWTTPADVSRVDVEMFMIVSGDESKVYPSDPLDWPMLGYRDIVLKKDSFSFYTFAANDKYVIIKCVDKFGNVSKGVKYEFSWGP